MEESGASCNSPTTQGRLGSSPQKTNTSGPGNIFQKQIANILKEKQIAQLASMAKGQLREAISKVKLEPEATNMVKEKQCTHLVTENEKKPCPRPVPYDEEKDCPNADKKFALKLKPCPALVSPVKENHGAKKEEQCPPRFSEEPVQNAINHSENPKKICFPNSHIRHTYFPGLSRGFNPCFM